MKMATVKNELKQLGNAQLQEKLEHYRRELFSLRLNAQTSHVKDHSQFKELRKNIARVLTFINQNSVQEKTKVNG